MPSESRFSEALSSPLPRMENRPLWRGNYSVVLPTLGMIVPNWFVVVPQTHTFNFAQQTAAVREELPKLVTSIFDTVSVAGDELLIFEHGPINSGSAVGCGVDHAHLHVVVAASVLVNSVWSAMERDLRADRGEKALGDLYGSIDSDQPYYMAWRRGGRLLEQPVRNEIPQRFRRIIAAVADRADEWDYRNYPFHENIANTVAVVRNRTPIAA